MLPIAGMHMEAGVLPRDSVPHGTFKDTVIDKRHDESKGSWCSGNKRVVEPDDSDALRFYRIKRIG